jgi:serine/threonine protein kinase
MGAVYLAEQPGLGREVAIKELIVSREADPIALSRFLQEAQLMAKTSHPNLVQIHDLEQVGDANYIILEYVSGRSLRDRVDAGPIPLPQSFAVMNGVLRALDCAHRHGIVHRDMKPENVLISDEGDVKVTDFGIARLMDAPEGSTHTRTGTTVGTPQYMSPEQVASSRVDGRSDIYSAGIMLYELVCGRPPFVTGEDDGPFTLMAKHVQSPPAPPTMLVPGLDQGLEEVMLKALAKRPDDRFQTGEEFGRALGATADRLCPGWQRSLEPGADLARMAPSFPETVEPPSAPAPATPTPIAEPEAVPSPPALPPPSSLGPSRRPWLYAAGGLGALGALALIAALAVNLTRGAAPPASVSPPTAHPSARPAGSCEFLKPGVALASGLGNTGCAVLGSAFGEFAFAGRSTLPPELTAEAFDRNGNPAANPSVPVGGGFATLVAPTTGYQIGVRSGQPAPANLIVIADFIPVTPVDADLGIGVRCTPAQCVRLTVSPKGGYQISQVVGGAKPQSLIQDQTAQIELNQPNRLVLSMQGSNAQGWLNGKLLARVGVTVPDQAGPIRFFTTDQDQAGKAEVHLMTLAAYQTA